MSGVTVCFNSIERRTPFVPARPARTALLHASWSSCTATREGTSKEDAHAKVVVAYSGDVRSGSVLLPTTFVLPGPKE